MPNPDPSEIPRPLFSRRPGFAPAPAPAEAPAERSEAFRPQYVSLHSLREHGHGPRNLAWGVVTLLLAVILTGVALFLTGAKSLLALAICLLTFTALFVLARMHVFRQRNGGFLALGIVCLFGASIPLLELSFEALDTYLKSRPAAPTVSIAKPAAPAPGGETLPLTEAFALTPPDPKSGPRVRVLKDSLVAIEGKNYLAKAGDTFAFASRKGREVTIAARDLLIALPADSVEVLEEKNPPAVKSGATPETTAKAPAPVEPPPETPAQITEHAQHEVIRRYPALGVKGSLENQMFVSLFTELRESGGDEFFQNPEWPLELAELLAKREGWTRSDGTSTPPPGTEPPPRPPEQ